MRAARSFLRPRASVRRRSSGLAEPPPIRPTYLVGAGRFADSRTEARLRSPIAASRPIVYNRIKRYKLTISAQTGAQLRKRTRRSKGRRRSAEQRTGRPSYRPATRIRRLHQVEVVPRRGKQIVQSKDKSQRIAMWRLLYRIRHLDQ